MSFSGAGGGRGSGVFGARSMEGSGNFFSGVQTEVSATGGGGGEKSYAQQFPMLYSQKKTVDDSFVHEMHLVMKGTAMLPILNFPEWVESPTQNTVFNISDEPVAMLGGMLYALDEFLFSECGFVQTLTKDVVCEMGQPVGVKDPLAGLMAQQSEGQDVYGHVTFGGLSGGLAGAASDRPSTSEGEGGLDVISNTSGGTGVGDTQITPYLKVTYRLTEYEALTGDWIVQSLQCVGSDGPKGKFFTRAFLPSDGVLPKAASGEVASAMNRRNSLRNPVYGEEKLRAKNPKLLRWCLERDPFELGNAATLIKHLLQYHKYSWTVLRLVKSLMKAIRQLQKFCRRVVRSKRLAQRKVEREWVAKEAEKLAWLQNYEPVPGDDVDAVVRSSLCRHYVQSEAEKLKFIEAHWKMTRDRFREQLQDTFHPDPFTWFIDVATVMHAAEVSLFSRLTMGDQSIFHHSKIKNLMAETAEQRKARRILEASRSARERAKNEY